MKERKEGYKIDARGEALFVAEINGRESCESCSRRTMPIDRYNKTSSWIGVLDD